MTEANPLHLPPLPPTEENGTDAETSPASDQGETPSTALTIDTINHGKEISKQFANSKLVNPTFHLNYGPNFAGAKIDSVNTGEVNNHYNNTVAQSASGARQKQANSPDSGPDKQDIDVIKNSQRLILEKINQTEDQLKKLSISTETKQDRIEHLVEGNAVLCGAVLENIDEAKRKVSAVDERVKKADEKITGMRQNTEELKKQDDILSLKINGVDNKIDNLSKEVKEEKQENIKWHKSSEEALSQLNTGITDAVYKLDESTKWSGELLNEKSIQLNEAALELKSQSAHLATITKNVKHINPDKTVIKNPALNNNWDTLYNYMRSEDVVVRLVTKGVLTFPEMSLIKNGKTSYESTAQLIAILDDKPTDVHAVQELKVALKETKQDYIASLL